MLSPIFLCRQSFLPFQRKETTVNITADVEIMNKKGNERYQETEKMIRDVFFQLLDDKDLHEITVSEICKKADIHRTTFYGHYEDVYDLMRKTIRNFYKDEMNSFLSDDEVHLHQGFIATFSLIKKNQIFFRYYFKHHVSYAYDESFLPDPLVSNMEQVMKKLGYRSEEELKYHQAFFCAGLAGLITRWINGGCKESEEEICRVLEEEYDIASRASFFRKKA